MAKKHAPKARKISPPIWPLARVASTDPVELIEGAIRNEHLECFLECLDRRCPKVELDIHGLRAMATPLKELDWWAVPPYRRMFFRWFIPTGHSQLCDRGATPATQTDHLVTAFVRLHPLLAKTSAQGKDTDWVGRGKSYIDAVREPLWTWADKYRVCSEPILHKLLDRCLMNVIYHSPTMDRPFARPDITLTATGQALVQPGDEAGLRKAIKALQKDWQRERSELRRWGAKVGKKLSVSPEERLRFEMLVCYTCLEMPIERRGQDDYRRTIADEFGCEREGRTISGYIQWAAEQVGLPTRSRGRPRKFAKKRT